MGFDLSCFNLPIIVEPKQNKKVEVCIKSQKKPLKKRLFKYSRQRPTLPRWFPAQYHRRWRAYLPSSRWDRVFPLRYSHRKKSLEIGPIHLQE